MPKAFNICLSPWIFERTSADEKRVDHESRIRLALDLAA
jgi:hypothetical protein